MQKIVLQVIKCFIELILVTSSNVGLLSTLALSSLQIAYFAYLCLQPWIYLGEEHAPEVTWPSDQWLCCLEQQPQFLILNFLSRSA